MTTKKMNNYLKGQTRYQLQRLVEEYANKHPQGDFTSWEDAGEHFARILNTPTITPNNLRTALETIRKSNYKMVKPAQQPRNTFMSNIFNRLDAIEATLKSLDSRISSLEEALK